MIVYLAWGSLIWNPLYLNITKWYKDGPVLPLEFSRISDYGKGRMTLVIDPEIGVNNRVYYAYFKGINPNEAIKMLKQRENTIKENIAYINLKKNRSRHNNTPDYLVNRIEIWAKENKFDMVIWTDLPSNWQIIRGKQYSVKDAIQYYEKSDNDTKIKIKDYCFRSILYTNIRTNFNLHDHIEYKNDILFAKMYCAIMFIYFMIFVFLQITNL